MIDNKAFMDAAKYIHAHRLSKPYTHVGGNIFDINQRFLILTQAYSLVQSDDIADCFKPETGQIDVKAFEKKFPGHKVIKVIHRPNHGLGHSISVAKHMPILKAFKQAHFADPNSYQNAYLTLEDQDILRLQLMALFSVSGREDEIGFHGDQNVYKTYRIKSATDYFDYFMSHSDEQSPYQLPDDMHTLIHDAIIIELMGNTNVREDLYDELGILKHIKENHSEVASQWSIDDKRDRYFNTGFNVYLDMLNIAHGLELLRVYKNDPTVNAEGRAQSTTRTILGQLMLSCRPEEKTLYDAVKIIEYARDLIEQRGDRLETNLGPFPKDCMEEYLISKDRANTQFIKELLNGQRKAYSFTFFEHCHYSSHEPDDAKRNTDEEVESTVYDLAQVQLPQLSFQEIKPSEEKINKRYYIKVIQPEKLDDFLAGQFEQKKVNLRRARKKAYTLTLQGIKQSIEKPSAFDKEGFSQHQSVTLVTSQLNPAAFSQFDQHTMAGVRYDEDAIIINRMLMTAAGTFKRPYDYDTKTQARNDLENKWKDRFFQDIDAFEKALIKKGPLNTNEVLAYLKWKLGTSSVCIFRDNLSSRLVSQEYARRIAQKIMGDGNTDSQRIHIPIHYYIRYSNKNEQTYGLAAQQEDIQEANRLYENIEEREKLFLDQGYAFLLTRQNAERVLTEKPDIVLELLALGKFFMVESLLNLSNKNFRELNLTVDHPKLNGAINKLYIEQSRTENQKTYLQKLLTIAPKDNFQTKSDLMIHMIAAAFEGDECLSLIEDKDLAKHLKEEDSNSMTPAQVALLHGHVNTFTRLCELIAPQESQALMQDYFKKVYTFTDPNETPPPAEKMPFIEGLIKYGDHQTVISTIEKSELFHQIPNLLKLVLLRNDRDKFEIIKTLHDRNYPLTLNEESLDTLFYIKKTSDNWGIFKQHHIQIDKRSKEIARYLFDKQLVSSSVWNDPLFYLAFTPEQLGTRISETLSLEGVEGFSSGAYKTNFLDFIKSNLKPEDHLEFEFEKNDSRIYIDIEFKNNSYFLIGNDSGFKKESQSFDSVESLFHELELQLGEKNMLNCKGLSRVKDALKEGQNASAILMAALKSKDVRLLRMALEGGADCHHLFSEGIFSGQTPFLFMLQTIEDPQILKLMFESQSDLATYILTQPSDYFGETPLISAMLSDNLVALKIILETCPESAEHVIPSGKFAGMTALMVAASSKNLVKDVLEAIITASPSTINQVASSGDYEGHIALTLALKQDFLDDNQASMLMEKDPGTLNFVITKGKDKGHSVLSLAGHAMRIKLFQEHPELLEILEPYEDKAYNALTLAIEMNLTDQAEAILAKNPESANFIIKNGQYKDYTPLHLAVLLKRTSIIQMLLEMNPKLAHAPTPEHDGTTALFDAIRIRDLKSVSTILEYCPSSIEARLNSGLTPITYAAFHGTENIIKILLEKYPNKIFDIVVDGDHKGECLLSLATMHNRCLAETIVNLFPDSIYTYERNPEGPRQENKISPLEFAIVLGLDGELEKILESSPQAIQTMSSEKCSMIYLAFRERNLTAFERMILRAPECVIVQPHIEDKQSDLFVLTSSNYCPLEFFKVLLEKLPEPILSTHLNKSALNQVLERAVREENLPLVSLCLNQGADPLNPLARNNSTKNMNALTLAYDRNAMAVVEAILKNSPNAHEVVFDKDFENFDGWSVMLKAIYEDKINLVKYLLDSGVDFTKVINDGKGEGFFPAVLACYWDRKKTIQILLESGIDFTKVIKEGKGVEYSLVALACYWHQKETIQVLLEHKPKLFLAPLSEGANKDKSALIIAHIRGYHDTVKDILKATLYLDDVKLSQKEGVVLLQHAVVNNDLELFELLSKHDIDLKQAFIEGPLKDQTVIDYAHEVVVKEDFVGWSLILKAIFEDRTNLIKTLLDHEVDFTKIINKGQYQGFSSVALAMHWNKKDTIQILLKRGVDFTKVIKDEKNEAKGSGYSLVALACFWNKKETIQVLLEHKPDLFLLPLSEGPNKDKSALYLAYAFGHRDTVKDILKATLSLSEVKLSQQEGALLLQHAVVDDELELFELLSKHGIDLEQVFEEGPLKDQTVINYVVENRQTQCLAKLLSLSPNLAYAHAPDETSYLEKAINADDREAVEIFLSNDPDSPFLRFNTLRYVVNSQKNDLLNIVFEHGANVHHLYNNGPLAGYTPFGWAMRHYHDEHFIRHFIETIEKEPIRSLSPNSPEPIEMLLMAIYSNNLHGFYALLDQHPNALQMSLASKDNALTAAIHMNNEEMATAIVRAYPQSMDYKIEQGENAGHTPVTLAIKENRLNLLKLLLEHEPSPFACQVHQGEDQGLTLLELAKKYTNSETQRLIQKYLKEDVSASTSPYKAQTFSPSLARASRTEKLENTVDQDSTPQSDTPKKPRKN